MKTSTKTLSQSEINIGTILAEISYAKLLGEKKDYFIDYKYEKIRQYYGQTCLDIGAGNCSFSSHLQQHNHQVTAIDVVDKSNSNSSIPIQLFDGKNIPHDDNSFDTSILMFVLHHTDNQHELLKECVRVTKKHIIVAEDIIYNAFDQWMGAIHLNTSPWDKGTDSFKSHRGWLDFFSTFNLQILEAVQIPRWTYPVYPVSRKIYVLGINDG